jgi:hypothetical protein
MIPLMVVNFLLETPLISLSFLILFLPNCLLVLNQPFSKSFLQLLHFIILQNRMLMVLLQLITFFLLSLLFS